MIATGIFLFLLGTNIGRASGIQSDVKYEQSRIAIREEIDQDPVLIPEGPPPYLPNLVHQGSNYFFGMPFPMPQGFLPPVPPAEKIVTEVIEEKSCKDIRCNSKITEFFVEKEKPPFINPVIEVNEREVMQNPKLSLPIPNIALNVQPIPYMPSVSIPIVNSQLISQLPLPSFNIPGLPILKSSEAKTPMLIKGPVQRPGDVIISEVDFLVKQIPPPPALPPLVLEEVLEPVIVEEKKVILIPAPPEIQPILPSSVEIAGRICPPTLCAQNIVFERVLPNIACEKSKTVELISIPASKRVPVVAKSLFSFVKK